MWIWMMRDTPIRTEHAPMSIAGMGIHFERVMRGIGIDFITLSYELYNYIVT
jgi:hypothetical protein